MKQETAAQKADRFIREATQFRLGNLMTESPHPVTRQLSQTAQKSIPDALGLLFEADRDVVNKYREWIAGDTAERVKDEVLTRLVNGGRIFFTGCGSTGRLSIQLDSIWRDFWQKQRAKGFVCSPSTHDWEDRTGSVMAGGDFALIKSVEGFEDFKQFGGKQISDMGVSEKDMVFAITEGGETSFVIGTAWKGLEKGAKVYFVYNNPDNVLCEHVIRSREVIEDDRIEKINLTSGPMSITGSTRMQATSIQLAVMLTILEMVLRDLLEKLVPGSAGGMKSETVPQEFMAAFEKAHDTLLSRSNLEQLAAVLEMEKGVYESGHKNSYFAEKLGIDVLTDTTERSPTYCVPAFRKFDDTEAAESWSFLFLPYEDTPTAWEKLIKRPLNAISWSKEEIIELVGEDMAARQSDIVSRIGKGDVLKFRIGLDGLPYRVTQKGDSVVCIVTDEEMERLMQTDGFYRTQLENAKSVGASTGLIFIGREDAAGKAAEFVQSSGLFTSSVVVPLPDTNMLLDGIKRVTAKLLLNALSTCTLVSMGRVLGNFMIWVVPSNLKLIDRSTRYISHLTGLPYEEACHRLYETIEYVEPRWQRGQDYPPPVGVSVLRIKRGVSCEEAEAMLKAGDLLKE